MLSKMDSMMPGMLPRPGRLRRCHLDSPVPSDDPGLVCRLTLSQAGCLKSAPLLQPDPESESIGSGIGPNPTPIPLRRELAASCRAAITPGWLRVGIPATADEREGKGQSHADVALAVGSHGRCRLQVAAMRRSQRAKLVGICQDHFKFGLH